MQLAERGPRGLCGVHDQEHLADGGDSYWGPDACLFANSAPRAIYQRIPAVDVFGEGFDHGKEWVCWRHVVEEAAHDGPGNDVPVEHVPADDAVGSQCGFAGIEH
eukprot:1005882-Rhodomonas_salina.4